MWKKNPKISKTKLKINEQRIEFGFFIPWIFVQFESCTHLGLKFAYDNKLRLFGQVAILLLIIWQNWR